jgi:hypothetical protein
VEYIKELLFKIYADKRINKISMDKFTKTIKAKELTMFRRSLKAYGEIILAPSDKTDK